MADGVQHGTSSLLPASDLARSLTLDTAPNGVRYTAFGETKVADSELERIVQAVPAAIAPALAACAFYFVPLAIPDTTARGANQATLISPIFTPELSDEAICHRNVQVPAIADLPAHQAIFISARLLRDQFALAFELFINVGHLFAESAGIPEDFSALAWKQALADVRGETSQDAFESRTQALVAGPARIDEKARTEFFEAAFADAVAIYLLSLAVDFDYAELREREYPLLAPNALADRLRLMARLFPPNPHYEFSIRYRRR
jgi:hypothetical protein